MSETTSTVTIQSKVLTDVEFTVRKMSYGLRTRIRRRLVKALSQVREKTDEIERLVEEHGIDQSADAIAAQAIDSITEVDLEAEAPPEGVVVLPSKVKETPRFNPKQLRVIDQIEDISREIDLITQGESDPVYLQECLVSISGYQVDGQVPDWKLLLEKGDENLCTEIIQAIKAEAGLTAKVKENLQLPTTSGAAAGGQMNDTTAPNASATAGGNGETVASTSQST